MMAGYCRRSTNDCSPSRALVSGSGCYGIVLLAPWDDIGLCLLVAVSSRWLTVNMQADAYLGGKN